ncbi:hypothetical protein [Sphingomonas crocodyli]|uniref:Uncharacterized protein n=1 Tax=Sphingomonas crocodyli TaxID=1979270 RepID=A0A437M544_9SPHN|nr:hypothetical protein [Sphingomonas crocodyli]RVT92850.1 hypothetical protein EOD43_02745 [Sphingomonas crocodyli]
MAEPPLSAEARIRAIIEQARRDEWADTYVVRDDHAPNRDQPASDRPLASLPVADPPRGGGVGGMRLLIIAIGIGVALFVGARAAGL